MNLKKIKESDNPMKHVGNWIYIIDKSTKLMIKHIVFHISDVKVDDMGITTYNVDNYYALYEPEYWERNGLVLFMENSIMTESLKKQYIELLEHIKKENIYQLNTTNEHKFIFNDLFSNTRTVRAISELDGKYLIEIFNILDKNTVKKERLDFNKDVIYKDIYNKIYNINPNLKVFKHVLPGDDLYVVSFKEIDKLPELLHYKFDSAFSNKFGTATATYDNGLKKIQISPKKLEESKDSIYFLFKKDAIAYRKELINGYIEKLEKQLKPYEAKVYKLRQLLALYKNELNN